MNKIPTILLLLGLLLLQACKHPNYPHTLQQAESVMNTRPDSALQLLQGMADSLAMLPEEAQMYYHLLTIQAKDKQYITHTSDSLINHIVSFYEDYGDKERLMMAYFYQGSTYRDMNDAPRALKAFHQAIDAGKETKNLTLLGQTYGQMGNLFLYQELYDEALEAMQKSLQYYTIQKDSTRFPYLNRDIARIYSAQEKNDSALQYYQTANHYATSLKLLRQRNSIMGEMGCLYYRIGKSDTAKTILKDVVTINPKASNACLFLGIIYKERDMLDSARYYFEKVLQTKDIRQQRTAYQQLSQLAETDNDTANTLHYNAKYQQLQDSITSFTQTEKMEKFHLLYRFQRSEKENYRLILENQKQETHLYAMLVVITIISCFTALLYMKYAKEKKAAIQQSLRYTHLKKQIEAQQIKQAEEKGTKIKEFRQTETFKKLNSFLPKLSPYVSEDWDKLQREIEQHFPSFIERVYLLHPNMTEHEFHVCMLLKAGIRIKDIALITDCESTSITHLRSRLYKKMTGKEGSPKDLDKLITDL